MQDRKRRAEALINAVGIERGAPVGLAMKSNLTLPVPTQDGRLMLQPNMVDVQFERVTSEGVLIFSMALQQGSRMYLHTEPDDVVLFYKSDLTQGNVKIPKLRPT